MRPPEIRQRRRSAAHAANRSEFPGFAHGANEQAPIGFPVANEPLGLLVVAQFAPEPDGHVGHMTEGIGLHCRLNGRNRGLTRLHRLQEVQDVIRTPYQFDREFVRL